jgi:hypothetical protein
MYCPQCGTDSSTGQPFCRSCGANLKVIAKAVSLSEAVARSDRGPIPKIKEMIKGIKVDQVTEEIARALDHVKTEINRSASASSAERKERRERFRLKREKTLEQRRENHLVRGSITFFSGMGFTLFLYYLSHAIVLNLPPDVISQIPFELDPVVRIIWLVGLLPTFSGLGRIAAGLLIKGAKVRSLEAGVDPQQSLPANATPYEPPRLISTEPVLQPAPGSVTDHTTELLDREVPMMRANEMSNG